MFEKQKVCGACGAPFECGGLWFCWCRDVRLDEATRKKLREQFADCLCPSCLKRVATESGQARAGQT